MKRIIDVISLNVTKRSGRTPAALLLGFALVAGACSNDNAAAPTTTAAERTATSVASIEAPPSTEPSAADTASLLDQLDLQGFDGVIAVRDDDDFILRAFGVADRENDVPVDAETVFDIGSITKQFTAAAILHLEMEGRLTVEDTLGVHVPGLPDDKAAITLHQLLTHTAGMPDDFGPDDEPLGRSEFLARFVEAPLNATPGDQFEYSNVGYALLAAVIEFETGEPYEVYLRSALFEPAGMLDTGYVRPAWEGHTIAVGYADPAGDRFGRPNEQVWNVDGPYWNLLGNGGILSTAADMLRWDQALIGDDVLDAAAKAKFFAPHVSDSPVEGIGYAYGWQVIPTPMGTPLLMHAGSNEVFYAEMMRFVDQDVAVFIVTNTAEDVDGDLAFEVANLVLDGELTAMADGDSQAAELHCGFGGLTIESLPDHPEIESLPRTPAGLAAQTLMEVLAEGDDTARLDFAVRHVSEQFGGDDLAAIADGVRDLQDQFTGYEPIQVLQQDARRFHVLMQGPNIELLLSMGFDELEPERLTCLAVSP